MNKKESFRRWSLRTWNFIVYPKREWQSISPTNGNFGGLMKLYFVPLVFIATLPMLLGLFFYPTSIVLARMGANILMSITSAFIIYKLISMYLHNKVKHEGTSMQLATYSFAIYTIFHSLSGIIISGFFNDLANILCLFSIRTLYNGITTFSELPKNQRIHICIVPSIILMVCPFLVGKFFKILFHIPTIYI